MPAVACPSTPIRSAPISAHRRRSRPARRRACSASRAAATSPASAAWSAGARSSSGTPKPYGGYFDEVTDALEEAYPGFADAIEKVVVDRGELTLHIAPARIAEVCQIMRDDESLRFELLLLGVRGGLPELATPAACTSATS